MLRINFVIIARERWCWQSTAMKESETSQKSMILKMGPQLYHCTLF